MRRIALLFLCGIVLCPSMVRAATILNPIQIQTVLAAATTTIAPCPPVLSGSAACFFGLSPLGQTLSYLGSDSAATLSGADSYGLDPASTNSLSFSGILDNGLNYRSVTALVYQFAVNGPANQTVDITIDGSGAASVNHMTGSSADLFAQGELDVYPTGMSNSPTLTADVCAGEIPAQYCGNVTPGYTGSLAINQTVAVTTDTAYTVELFTNVLLQTFSSTPIALPDLSASVTIDPTITLDTSDPAYSLQFSPVAAPEPSSLLLSATGVIAAVIFRRRRLSVAG